LKITNCVYWYKADSSSCNSYLILNDFGVLIDPGTTLRQRPKKILQEMKKDGLNPENIKELWLTHCHPDHSQAAKSWAKAFDLKIKCHPEAQKILEEKNPLLSLINREIKTAGRYSKELISSFDLFVVIRTSDFIYGKWETVKVEIFKSSCLQNGALEIQLLFPQVHSPDDACFWLPKEKILINGDLFDTKRGNPYSPVLIFPTASLNNCLKFIDQLIILEPEIFCPGHGPVIFGKNKISNYFKKIKERAESYKEKTLDFLKKKPKVTFYEIGKNLETRKNVSASVFTAHSTLSILGFVVLKALKEDGYNLKDP
jgi:glyoxylase-like metal-dependent hydrolase (beta-lactamase superfamily II)